MVYFELSLRLYSNRLSAAVHGERERKDSSLIVFVWPQAGDRETFAAVEANRCVVRETTYLLRESQLSTAAT